MELSHLFGVSRVNSTTWKSVESSLELEELVESRVPLREEGGRGKGGRSILESVIGTDDRALVPETTRAPWSSICCLTIVGENGARARGTGWFIGPRTLITAGHCVFSNILFQGWAREIIVEPGRNGDILPFGRSTSSWFSTLRDWVATEHPDSDVGCIQLDEPLGDVVGYLDVDVTLENALDPMSLGIAGYPVDRESGTSMYSNQSRLLRATPTQLYYDVDTVGGQSGAPIWVVDRNGTTRVVGVHAYGASGIDTNLGIEANSGPRFTSDLLVTVTRWVEENS